MTSSTLPHDELFDLLAKHCAGDMEQGEAQRLADAVRGNADARRTYIEYMDLHHALAWEASSAAEIDALFAQRDVVRSAAERSSPPADAHPAGRAQRVVKFFVATRLRVALSVASCFLVVLLGMLAFTPAPLFQLTRPDVPLATDRVVAARITGSVDCRWQETALPLGFGSSLYKGQQVELLAGSAEITFDNGAVVTLRGPATYVIDSSSRSSLREGELTALVPRRARGFAVQTRAALIIDLGTEFGVIVTPPASGDGPFVEEVHVFQGVVELSLRDSNAPPRRLTKDEAYRVTSDGRLEPISVATRSRFPQRIDEEGDTTTAQALPPEEHPPVTRALTLWLSADGAVRRDGEGRVQVWEDMPTGENTKAQNAMQHLGAHRPHWVASAINGKPAIRFDGDDVLTLATPSNLGLLNRPYEIFIVARTASPGIQFLIAGGVEDFEIHVNGDAGARFIPAGYNAGTGASDLGPNGQFSDGRAHIFAARVDAHEHRGVVSVDGKETSDLTAADARSQNNTSLRLGMRHDASFTLQGEIAEVLIFADALSPQERNMIGEYLTEKY